MWFRQFRTSFSFDRKLIASDWIHNWKYSRWLVGGRTIGIAPIIAIPWLIAFFQGEEGTGIYAVCSSVVGLSMMFVTGVNNLYQPKTVLEFQKNGVRGMTSVVIESVFIVSIVLTIISVIFWFFGDQVLRYYGANYAQYGYLAFLLSVSTLIISISGMAGNGLVALGKAKELFWGEVSYCVVTIVAAIILVPSHGLVGVGYSWILGSLTATTVTTIALIQSLHTHQQQLGPLESRVSLIRDEIPGA
jgi:O-antigen/teichoic acid export membrane protein